MDLDGVGQGIGVILEGSATDQGDPSRGARYNSAIRYVETISKNPNYANCFAVVISEDGDVDMILQSLLDQRFKKTSYNVRPKSVVKNKKLRTAR